MDMAAKFIGKSSACSTTNIITLQKILTEAAIFSGSKNLAQFANQTTVRCFGKNEFFSIKKCPALVVPRSFSQKFQFC